MRSHAAIRRATPRLPRATRAPSRPIATSTRAPRRRRSTRSSRRSRKIPTSTSSRDRRCWKPAEAVAPLRHAVQLAPNPALIQIMLGQALVATHDRGHLDEAVSILQAAVVREPESPEGFMQLAMAYGQKNDLARADLASAQA